MSLLPFWLDLEEHVGLGLLFFIRGSRSAPEDVAIVSIDKTSADTLDLPSDPSRWPRSLHARLTDNLARAGAKVIVFDIFFEHPRVAEEDALFGSSIAKAQNVVLSRYVSRETVPFGDQKAARSQLNIERLVLPIPVLADAAVASAAFPLPKLPVRLHQYWKFKSDAGGAPTLPVVALQVFAAEAYDDLVRMLVTLRPDEAKMLPSDARALIAAGHLEDVTLKLRDVFESSPSLADAMLQATRTDPVRHPERLQRLRALIRMYQGPDSEYLNFYGPPRTVRTLSYHRVVSADTNEDVRLLGLQGKAVFVGLSDYLRPEQRDGFHTIFSQDGVDISGAEIAATAFANLLNDQHVRPLGLAGYIGVVLSSGILLGAVCAVLTPARAATCVVGFGAAYLAMAVSRFALANAWYPITAVFLLEAPAAFVGAILWRYANTNRERVEMRKAFSYYLPGPVIDELLRNAGGVVASGHTVYGICLATDAERYTSLAESMEPEELARFVNRYYAIIFDPIRRYGGTISDVVGDAALALWTAATLDPTLRRRACHAACELLTAVEHFNRETEGVKLPTRIGLHAGPMVLGNVGAVDHYEYRAVGDIVNTATRIQELNKRFRTRILASDDVVVGLDDFLTRRLGTFVLAGKTKPLVIHEVMCRHDEATERQRWIAARFSEGVSAYEEQSWLRATEAFGACLKDGGDDGAARFYLNACAQYQNRQAAEPWEAVFRMETK